MKFIDMPVDKPQYIARGESTYSVGEGFQGWVVRQGALIAQRYVRVSARHCRLPASNEILRLGVDVFETADEAIEARRSPVDIMVYRWMGDRVQCYHATKCGEDHFKFHPNGNKMPFGDLFYRTEAEADRGCEDCFKFHPN